jgi:chemotaxis protein MotB
MKPRNLAYWMAAVLVTGCVTEGTYQQEVKKTDTLQSQNETYEKLNTALKSEVAADQVQIEQLQGKLKVTMVDQILFPEGGWEVGRKGEETLDKVIPTFKTLKGQRIEIEGFTDNVPIGPELKKRFPSNWELSTARATDVVRYLVSKGVSPSLLSASGFGDTRPVASNDTPQGRAKNRRIEVIVRAESP